MTFRRLTTTVMESDLAVRQPEDWLHEYDEKIDALRPVYEQEQRHPNSTRAVMAVSFLMRVQAVRDMTELRIDPSAGELEAVRHGALGVLALSPLYLSLIQGWEIANEAVETLGYAGAIVDVGFSKNPREDPRLHVSDYVARRLLADDPTSEEPPVITYDSNGYAWYQDGNVLTCATRRYSLSPQAEVALKRDQVQTPSAGLTTIFPYMASLSARTE